MMKKSDGKVLEKNFKAFCTHNGIYCNRLNDNIGNVQVADYLIIFKEKYRWLEVKEVEKNNTYPFNRTTQEKNLLLVTKINVNTESHILIYFKQFKQIVYLTIDEYIKLKNESKTKSILKLNDVPKQYIFNWSNLIIKFLN